MSEKKKSTPNAKVLTVLLIVLFFGSCVCFLIAVFTGSIGSDIIEPTDALETTVSETIAETQAADTKASESTSATETAATEVSESNAVASAAVIVAESYAAKSAVDLDGNSVDMRAYFGSGFASYGGTLSFEGQRFAINMGVSSGSSSSSVGSYDIISLNEMELDYDNSDIAVATFEVENDTVVSISVPMDDITVTFVAE